MSNTTFQPATGATGGSSGAYGTVPATTGAPGPHSNGSDNGTEPAEGCLLKGTYLDIDKETLNYVMVGLGVASIILFCFLKKRKHRDRCCCNGLLDGRPGLAYPVELIEESESRFFHVAAFCLTTSSLIALVVDDTPFGWQDVIPWLSNLVKVVLGLIYGLIYYPIFAALSSRSAIGYAWGSIYTWAVTVVYIVEKFPCYKDVNSIVIFTQVLQMIPIVILSLCLCIFMPYKLIQVTCFKAKEKANFKDNDFPQVQHVKYLLKKRRKNNVWDKLVNASKRNSYELIDVKPQSKSLPSRAVQKAKDVVASNIYVTSPGFLYSVNVLSACALSWFVAYIMFCKVIYYALVMDAMMYRAKDKFDSVANNLSESGLGDSIMDMGMGSIVQLMTTSADSEVVFWRRLVKGCYYTSFVVSLLITSYSVLMVMRNYKRDLILMYKGIYLFIPKDTNSSAASITVKATKFLGYQVAYAASGYVLMSGLLLVITILLSALVAIIFRYQAYDILLYLVVKFVPSFIILAAIYFIQRVLVSTCFLLKNDNGVKVMALDNRNFFHNFQYFMVFMNAAIGLLSSLMTIGKAAFCGIWTIPRLDISAFPRRFERFDAGFTSYCGMLELDKALRNPSMVVFVTLMLESVRRRNERASRHSNPDKWKDISLRYERVSNHWGLLVTLVNNPALAKYRRISRNDKHQRHKAKGSARRSRHSSHSDEDNLPNVRL